MDYGGEVDREGCPASPQIVIMGWKCRQRIIEPTEYYFTAKSV